MSSCLVMAISGFHGGHEQGGQLPIIRNSSKQWGQVFKISVLRRGMDDLSGFFDSVHMGRCKIPPAMNDPDDVYLLRFDLVENPV